MNIVLISNSAPNYYNFFNALSRLFINQGSNVVVAVDSAFSRRENQIDSVGFEEIYEFSDFFKNHQTDFSILSKYADYNLNAAILSDFERSEVYGVWGNNVSIEYFDRLKSSLLTYFEMIFDKHLIDTVLYEGVSNTFSHYALFVAQKKGVRYWGLSSSRLPGRFMLTSDPLADDTIEEKFKKIQLGHLDIDPNIRKWADEYISNIENIVPDYMKINGLDRIGIIKRYFRKDRIKKIISLAKHVFDSRTDAFQVGNPVRTHASLFWRNVKRRMRARFVTRLYELPVEGEKFLLYPMHFRPEA